MATVSSPKAPEEIKSFFEKFSKNEIQISEDRRSTTYKTNDDFLLYTDNFGGCHISLQKNSDAKALQDAIENLALTFEKTKTFDSLWVESKLPVKLNAFANILPDSFEMGAKNSNLIHDLQKKEAKAWVWLNNDKECSIPAGATHNVGATAIILDKIAQKVLLVENLARPGQWNLPGGSYEPLQDTTVFSAALREAQEEGGFEIKEKDLNPSLIGEMDFKYNQFAKAINQIWAVSIDNISKTNLNPPKEEIKQARWVNINYIKVLLGDEKLIGLSIGKEVKLSIIAAINGLGCEKIVDKDWLEVYCAQKKEDSEE